MDFVYELDLAKKRTWLNFDGNSFSGGLSRILYHQDKLSRKLRLYSASQQIMNQLR